jgi:structure-specific recognition protein 1
VLLSSPTCSNDKRDEVKKANPDIKFGEVAKEISALWKTCTPSEKKKYESAAEKEKERYQRESADYQSRGGAGAAPAKKAKKPAAKKAAKSESEQSEDEEDDE